MLSADGNPDMDEGEDGEVSADEEAAPIPSM